MKTKTIEYRLRKAREAKSRLYKDKIKPLDKEIDRLYKMRIASIIKSKEYITDLSEYEDKYIISIKAIDSKGAEVFLPTDEGIEVSEGRLSLSSYEGGLVYWYKDKGCYVHAYHMIYKDLDILGFIDIETGKRDW